MPQLAFANPQDGAVTHGSAVISGEGTDSVTITQSSERAFIEWDSFSVGTNERVDFIQPSANAVTANKVIGTDPSQILGQVSATGRLLIINGNGVIFGRDSVIDAASFIASTHDIAADDIMTGQEALTFSGGTASIINNGNIALREGGIAALLAPHIVNNGVITARLGTISLGASQSVSIDFYGDGLLSFSSDSALTQNNGDGTSLIDQQGQIIADGGLIQMSTKAASDVITQSVNIGGLVRAQTVQSHNGRIILSGDDAISLQSSSELDATGGGTIEIDAASIAAGGIIDASSTNNDGGTITLTSAGKTNLSARIDASSDGASGGEITIQTGSLTQSSASILDASGTDMGGSISVVADTNLMSSGTYDASASDGQGGLIDVTARDLRSLSASFDASGTSGGGRVRIGGAFQGGKELDLSQSYINSFVTRWPQSPGLSNAAKTFLNDGTHINVSATNGTGGTAILWSDIETTFLGSLSATGTSGGSVEISSAATLRYANLSGIDVGDGTLLLDPKNITIGSSTEVQSWSYQGLIGRWYVPDISVSTLDSNDNFGGALALSNNSQLLAVGASGDDGASGSTANAGAVYLFRFTDGNFSGGTLSGIIGSGYQNGGNLNVTSLEANDAFGASVALDDDGNRLAVGATGDDGNNNGEDGSGAVYLFSFTNTQFGGGALVSTIGDGYSALNVALDANDDFGAALALNSDGSRMLVGASGDDGVSNSVTNAGSVYMMTFADTSYSTPSLFGTIGAGYVGADDLDVDVLDANDAFGSSVAVSSTNTRALIGAPGDDGDGQDGATDIGAAYLFSFENENYKQPAHEITIGSNYKSNGNLDVGGTTQDRFGASVALSADGTLLAIGIANDDGLSAAPNTNYGAVMLFEYGSTDLDTAPTIYKIGKDYSGTGDLAIPALATSDSFGAAVALNGTGDRLAVGMTGGDGGVGGSTNSGEVTLLSIGSSSNIEARIGEGYINNSYANNPNLQSDENFGVSVALNDDATRMVVGATKDGGSPDSATNYGSVSLYSFSDSDFSGATLEGTIGYGYTGAKDVNFNSGGGDDFGISVALNGTGDRLAVGEASQDGKGAVHLFTFADNSFTTGTLDTTISDGFTDTNGALSLDNGDEFGSSVSLSDDASLLVVGAKGDDGTAGTNTGAGYLFRFSDSDFSDGERAGIIGSGYSNTGDVNITLDANDQLGSAVSLDSDGNRLAIGASRDGGFGADDTTGAVLLISFGDTNFNSGTLSATIGDGYTGSNNVDVANLGKNDFFGTAVALNDTGDRLAVGAPGDDGSLANDTGAVYLFSFGGDDFTSGALTQLFGQGYTASNQFDVTTLEANDGFGTSLAFNGSGDRLVVGATGDDGGYNNQANAGVVHLFNAAHSAGGYRAEGQSFANLGSDSITVNAYQVADILNRGTNLTLQASNDITVGTQVQVGGFAQSAGDLILRAGRSIAVNESISTNGGDISLIANDTAANGVVEAQRDSGAATIAIATNRTLNAGSGDISLLIADASDRTNNTSGAITLNRSSALIANQVTVSNQGPSSGSDIVMASSTQINASATGDAITLNADAFNNSAGSGALNATNGRFQLWTVDDSGYDISELSPDFIQYGATYGTTAIASGASGDGVFYRNTASVSADFRYAATKTYDGTVTASVADADIGVTGVNAGETVVLTASSASFDNRNVGTGKTVTLSGLSVASASRGSMSVYGYNVTSSTASNSGGIISAKALDLTGHSAQDKSYDGTRSASVSYGTLDGVISGDTVSLDSTNASNQFADANVGTGKTVTFSGLALSGADSGNYSLANQTSTADISAATLTLASSTADDKIYDGDASATISAYGALTGIFGSDTVSIDSTGVSASFANANVGASKTVTLSGLGITGADASNYSLASSATTTADITARALSITGHSAQDKSYDGTRSATVSYGTLDGVISGDTVSLDSTNASNQFADANVGTGKTVTFSGLALSGADSGNYSLANQTSTADISAATLTLASSTADDKIYDGDASATISAYGALTGIFGSDTVSIDSTGVSASFANANVGASKTVTLSGLGITGADASNYSLASGATTTADITAKALSIGTATISDKTYDGTNAITVSQGSLSGLIGSQTLSVSASGTTGDSDAGTGKYVTIAYSLSDGSNGGLASNYSLADGAGSADISAKALSYGTVSVSDKIYDGSNSASVTATSLTGFIGSETVTALSQASFTDANVGASKTANITFALADGTNGGKSSNYSLAALTRQADITAKALSITGTSLSDKIYDATTSAQISAGTLSGLIGSETLDVSATGAFADSAVGTGKSVSVSYNLSNGTNGGLASNYSLSGTSLSADITARALSLNQLAIASKTYDGTNAANISSSGTLTDIQGSDDVSLDDGGASAVFNSVNAGTVGVTLSGFGLSGTSASNYTLTLPNVTGTITQKTLQINNSLAANKSYDGNRDAIVISGTVSGFIASEIVSADGIGQFANANPGFDKAVAVKYLLKDGANGGLAANYVLGDEVLYADIEGRTKERADSTAPMVEKQAEMIETDIMIERTEKLEMIEEVEFKTLQDNKEAAPYVETIGDWTILTCETTGAQQGMCSAK